MAAKVTQHKEQCRDLGTEGKRVKMSSVNNMKIYTEI